MDRSVYGVTLPSINSKSVGMQLFCGAVIRNVAITAAYFGVKTVVSRLFTKDFNATIKRNTDEAKRYLLSSVGEAGISVMIFPMKYLAAVTTQRFLFDFMLPSWSDSLSVLDFFKPAEFMSFALHAFASEQDWNWDFFLWQIPSIAVTLAKLVLRRRRVGAEKCRTKRVIAVALLHVFVRSFVASFCVQLPQTDADALVALVMVGVESICANYLIRHTWPVTD